MVFENSAAWEAALVDFLEPFAAQFQRSETRTSVQNYVRGLLAEVKRKNGWQLAEEVGLTDPHPLQRLLNEAQWADEAVRRQLRAVINAHIGYQPGIGVLDESGFVKWGQHSAGVARQYCGRLGKVENCQVGVYLGYVAPTGAALLDCQLYLPQAWCDDRERCRAAKIPDAVPFQTKPQIAQALLEQAWAEGLPMDWVVGDTLYGNSPHLRDFIDQQGRQYMLEIGSHHRVTLAATGHSLKLAELTHSLAAADWEQLCFRVGEQGLLAYQWQAQRVSLAGDALDEQWLLIQRSLDTSPTMSFHLANAPFETPLTELAAVALSRHSIEDLLGEAKSEVGMADYEVRHWHGWHRHMTLVLLAHTWLKLMQHAEREKKPAAPV
jgi:SRSO17 transposase